MVGTTSVMSALIIYDGWEKLRFLDGGLIIVGPIIAIFASHVFAGAIGERVQLGRDSLLELTAPRMSPYGCICAIRHPGTAETACAGRRILSAAKARVRSAWSQATAYICVATYDGQLPVMPRIVRGMRRPGHH